jgi:superfamily II DNA/RNA helicase
MYEYDVPEEAHIALPQRPELLFSLAVGLLGDAAADMAGAPNATRSEAARPEILSFSGTYFDAYVESRLSDFAEIEFPTLAAASYYLANSPGSAKVLVIRAAPPDPEIGLGLALLTYRLLRGDYSQLPEAVYDTAGNELLTGLAQYFDGEGQIDDVVAVADRIRTEAYTTGDGRELLYADVIGAIVRKKIASAAATILPDASNLSLDTWRVYLRRASFPRELWPSQQRICAAGILRGNSCVIQMPTSAGKTRATELILRSGFLSDRVSLAVIVCPYRSLCHDIRGDMARAFAGENVVLNEATDSFQADLSIEDLWVQKTILIVTPEKLLYLLRRTPELATHIGLVIYDEGHQFDSGARGVTYELLLTSLKLLLAEETQVILISAVIANAPSIAAWLIGDQAAVVDGQGLLPTVRSIAFASWRDVLGRMEYVNPLDPDDGEFFVPRVIEQKTLPLRGHERTERYFPEPGDGPSVGLYLGLKLVARGSVAIFCGRRDTAAKICASAVDLFERTEEFQRPANRSDRLEVERLTSLFEQHLGGGAAATRAASLGIFPHHGSVPHGMRLAVEYAMKANLIHFVVCTSTLAQGVNLPIRYLIVTGVYQGADRILVRDFHNLLGRAGRAGMHTEGSVIFADTKVFDNKLNRRERWRWRTARELLDPVNAEPSLSSISAIFEPFRYGRPEKTIALNIERLHRFVFDDEATVDVTVQQVKATHLDLIDRDFRRFLQDRVQVIHGIASFLLTHLDFAAEGVASRAVELARNTLAHFLADDQQRAKIELVFRNVATRLLEGAATEDLRTAIRRSPLGPGSVEALRRWLNENREVLSRAMEANSLLTAVTTAIIQHNRSTTITSLSDRSILVPVMFAWVGGASFANIYDMMIGGDIRIGGNHRRPTVEDAVSLCENGLGYEGAMIVATLADLAEGDDEVLFDALSLLQRQMKIGLASQAALGFFEAGFADRVVAQSLADAFPNVADRHSARAVVRANNEAAHTILTQYPAYFVNVLDELAA